MVMIATAVGDFDNETLGDPAARPPASSASASPRRFAKGNTKSQGIAPTMLIMAHAPSETRHPARSAIHTPKKEGAEEERAIAVPYAAVTPPMAFGV